jgi:hypothetical protein
MFEKDIATAAYQGVMLHNRDGSEFWKLRLTCTHEPCPKEVELGECLCFATEEAMVKARDNHGFYCSAKCWAKDRPEDEVQKHVDEARRALKQLDPEDVGSYVDDWKDDISVVTGYWEYMAELGGFDGEVFYEMYDVEDCPI